MKKFYFRLDKYRNLKLQEEKVARLELARARRAFQEESGRLAALEKKTGQLLAANRKLLEGQIQRELLSVCKGYLRLQRCSLEEQAAAAIQAEEKMKRERQAYLEVRKDSKLLERLYQRQWEVYYQDLLREEQKVLDEIGLISYSRD
ncbi:MAG TPA: flagellar export protein FliJ [Syntrophomonadaceae bacterium]|nr:flagellar export protein FliJ [Syntrophomonadaceae bacterium]